MKTRARTMKVRKLKIRFVQETCFVVPTWAPIRSWNQRLDGPRVSLRELALAEPPKSVRHKFD